MKQIHRKIGVFILLFFMVFGIRFSQAQTISGTITDKATGETLIGATVMDVLSGKGTVSNNHGRYSLTLKDDTASLIISYVGYASQTFSLKLDGALEINAQLQPSIDLKTVSIRSERPTDAKSSQMSAIAIPVEHLKSVPVMFGETDVLKTLQLMPGVQSGSEGMSGIYVRGGGPDENLFLLDGVPMYNVNHLGGFFSAFNADAIKNVTLYKGSFPARFSGRLSSVLDITTNNGNDKEYHGNINIGAISSKISLEGPIVKEKTTFSVSARRTYADILLQPFISLLGTSVDANTNAGYYFYDLNAKITHKISEKSRLYASFYSGDDVIYAKFSINDMNYGYMYDSREYLKMNYNWGNIVGSLRWNYVINPQLFMNVSASYSRYRNDMGVGLEYFYESTSEVEEYMLDMTYKSGIQDFTSRVDFDYSPNTEHNIKFGGAFTHHIFTPSITGLKTEYNSTYYVEDNGSIDTIMGESIVHAEELNLYIEDDWSITDALKMNYGVNLSGFLVEGTFYPSIQPRLSGRWLISDNLSFKTGYAYMTQYLHLLSTSGISLPTDLWVPVTAKIEPMNAHQIAAGFAYNLENDIDISIEGYYKSMNNLMEYKDGASFFSSSANWEDKVCLGRGWAYGLEFLVQKTMGKLTGWAAYTWSKSMRLFDRPGQVLSSGKPFPSKYDRRHDVSIVMMYKPNNNFDISATWVYCTGTATTFAMDEFEILIDNDYSTTNQYIESRNNLRMPDYHRMDVSMNFHKQKKHGVRTWSLSVYNVYNRHNPYMLFESNGQLMQLSIFPIIPTVSYQYKF